MDAVTYSDERVLSFIADHYVPLRVNTKENPDLVCRFWVNWSPESLVLDHEGREHRRMTGYLPPEEYLGQLGLARGNAALDRQDYAEAIQRFSLVVCHYQNSDASPEAYYWMGVARYKKEGSPQGLMHDWKALAEKHPQSIWAKKASFLLE